MQMPDNEPDQFELGEVLAGNLIFLWRISSCPSQVNRRRCTGGQSSLRVAPPPKNQTGFLLGGGYRLHVDMNEATVRRWGVVPGGGGTPLYKVCRYVPPQRVWFLSRFGLK